MKTQLTSVDLRFLTRELADTISGARIDKAYQLGEKELKVRFHAVNRGSMDLVLAPGYAALKRPSSLRISRCNCARTLKVRS